MKSRFLTAHQREKRVLAAMKERGLSWYRLAKIMGRDQNSIQNSLLAKNPASHNPNLDTLKLVATAVDCTVGFLVDKRLRIDECPHCGKALNKRG